MVQNSLYVFQSYIFFKIKAYVCCTKFVHIFYIVKRAHILS